MRRRTEAAEVAHEAPQGRLDPPAVRLEEMHAERIEAEADRLPLDETGRAALLDYDQFGEPRDADMDEVGAAEAFDDDDAAPHAAVLDTAPRSI